MARSIRTKGLVGQRAELNSVGVFNFIVAWLFGVALALFPRQVHASYSRFIREGFTRRNTPQTVRNTGVAWLVLMTVLTYLAWRQH